MVVIDTNLCVHELIFQNKDSFTIPCIFIHFPIGNFRNYINIIVPKISINLSLTSHKKSIINNSDLIAFLCTIYSHRSLIVDVLERYDIETSKYVLKLPYKQDIFFL